MTEEQKKYYNAMKKLGSKKPQKPIPRPLVSSLCRPRAGGTPYEDTAELLQRKEGADEGRPVPSSPPLAVHPQDVRKGISWLSSG